MYNDAIANSGAADELLDALSQQLDASGACFSLAVVGGSALLMLGVVTRATRDVDVVALVEAGRLLSADPLPESLRDAARIVARDFGLSKEWLNPGPTSLLEFGLPCGFQDRAHRRRYGDALEVLFASRIDQIHLKLYATVDQGTGKHLADLRALRPTQGELLEAARWSCTHDPSEGYRAVLVDVLDHFGVDRGLL